MSDRKEVVSCPRCGKPLFSSRENIDGLDIICSKCRTGYTVEVARNMIKFRIDPNMLDLNGSR